MRKIETIEFDFKSALADGKRGQRATMGILDEVCDIERTVIDQRHLDDEIIELYGTFPNVNGNKWLSVDSVQDAWHDKMTKREIDGFDEYSKDELSKEHLLDIAQDKLRSLICMTYKEWLMFDYLDIQNTLINIAYMIEEGRK